MMLGRLERSFNVDPETGRDEQLVEKIMSIICLSRRGVTEHELLLCVEITQATLSPLLWVAAAPDALVSPTHMHSGLRVCFGAPCSYFLLVMCLFHFDDTHTFVRTPIADTPLTSRLSHAVA